MSDILMKRKRLTSRMQDGQSNVNKIHYLIAQGVERAFKDCRKTRNRKRAKIHPVDAFCER